MTPISIGHLDADSFYVSAERVRKPLLRGKPVCVLGNQGACCIAKSYEAKAAGIKTGTAIWDAVKICPEVVFVKRDFEWYEVLSRQMLACVREISQTVEYYSIDEFFFDASLLTVAYGGTLTEATAALQQRILEKCGVPVSIGIAASKTLAKLASDANKPFGYQVLTEQVTIDELVATLPTQEITGVGGRSAKKLANLGIHTVADFMAADRAMLRKLLTIKGEQIWWELHGEAVIPILTSRPMHKHLARGGSLGKGTGDHQRVTGWVARNVERLIEALRINNYHCRSLALDLSYKKGGGRYAKCNLPASTNHCEIIMPAALGLLKRCWRPGQTASYMHVIGGDLELGGSEQLALFGPRQLNLDRIKHSVNDKLGRFTVRSGTTLPLTDVYCDESQQYDICDVHGKSCF